MFSWQLYFLLQVNQATHYLDASQLYGCDKRKSDSLRSFVNGQLEVTSRHSQSFLPLSENPTQDCQVISGEAVCFASGESTSSTNMLDSNIQTWTCFIGDSRVNSHPQLTAMYTIWHREHNRIAKELAVLNPTWNDEKLYQEARRIVIAEIQSVTYNEWLPTILGMYYS